MNSILPGTFKLRFIFGYQHPFSADVRNTLFHVALIVTHYVLILGCLCFCKRVHTGNTVPTLEELFEDLQNADYVGE